MTQRDREELKGEHIDATYKLMPNGEKRFRLRPENVRTHSVILTKASAEACWQKPHYHKGLVESYKVISGSVGFVWRSGPSSHSLLATAEDCRIICFKVCVEHNVLPHVGSEFITWQVGIPQGNPNRGGSDWWDANDDFQGVVLKSMSNVEPK